MMDLTRKPPLGSGWRTCEVRNSPKINPKNCAPSKANSQKLMMDLTRKPPLGSGWRTCDVRNSPKTNGKTCAPLKGKLSKTNGATSTQAPFRVGVRGGELNLKFNL